ncbi:MAG: hypothetical protein MJ106_04345 [Lentisphaeria bacterium]|nr:hypothetical protein [Lentisphaeria bacterium]
MKKNNFAKLLTQAFVVCAIGCFCVACASTAKFDYAASEGMMLHMTLPQKLPPITVVPFRDIRVPRVMAGEEGEEASVMPLLMKRGSFATGWLPFMPYAWISRVKPEANDEGSLATLGSFWCQWDKELAEAAVKSLEASTFFQEVKSAESRENAETRYIFTGSIWSTEYQGERITYGVTYLLAPALWLIGFPDAVSHNKLGITFRIIDLQTGRPIWRYRFEGKDSTVHFLYARVGEDASRYAQLMKTAMNAVLFDLKTQLEKVDLQKNNTDF